MTYTAFVPARSGSKRVPGKNIKLLAGKPLLIWTLQAFSDVEAIDTVILSTDSEEYWEIAQKHIRADKLQLDFRIPDDAGDKVKIFDYLKQKHEKIFQGKSSVFLMGLPTVPFRNSKHITEAIALHESTNCPIFSATEYDFPIAFAFYKDKQKGWKPASKDCPMITGNTRSQDQLQAYHPNGAIYIRQVLDLADPAMNTLYDNALPYLMGRNSSVDIDNESDFLIADAMAKSDIIKTI